MFKIDLIVWKLLFLLNLIDLIKVFKIDLIVWKLHIKLDEKNNKYVFKIDLIVWKFINIHKIPPFQKSLK